MSDNKRNIDENTDSTKSEGVSGLGKGTQTGPVAGGADNTRGENKPSREGTSGGAKKGKEDPNQNQDRVTAQDPNANLTTTSRGADSTDKEFRNDQPNASTLKGHKSNVGLSNEKD